MSSFAHLQIKIYKMGVVLRAFKTKQPFLLLFLPIIAVAFWLKWFINPVINWDVDNLMPFASLLVNSLKNTPLVIGIVSVVFILLTSYGLYFINERYQILRKGSNLPSLFYLLLVSALSSCIGFNPVIFAAFFILIAFERLLFSYKMHKNISSLFDIGFAIGVATGFYFYSGVFLAFVILSLFVIGRVSLREFLALIVGVLLPALFIWTYYFYTDQLSLLVSKLNYGFSEGLDFIAFSFYQWVFIGFVALLYVISLAGMFLRNALNEIFDIKFFTLLFWLTAFGLALPVLFFPKGVEIVFIINIAVAFFLSRYFVMQRHRWLGDAFILLFIAAVVLLQFPALLNYF